MERKKEYTSLEEAFAALPAAVQEHSHRVKAYADLLFIELCGSDEYTLNINSRVRLRYDNRSMVETAALYHDIGKVFVPEVYDWPDEDYNHEEEALYRRHCLAGEQMVRHIMREQKGVTHILEDVICEAVSGHHECWDGSGFPGQYKFEDTPVIGRLVAVADALDHYLMETRTETPVQTAFDKLMEHAGTRFDPVIVGLLQEQKYKVDKIFALHRDGANVIPQAPRIIRRKSKRPLWLTYRPVLDLRNKNTVMLQGIMQFRKGKDTIGFTEAEPVLAKMGKLNEAMQCFMTEAVDTVKRIRACEVPCAFISLLPISGFWKKRGTATAAIKFLEDIDADPETIGFVLQGEGSVAPSANVIENVQKLRRAGCRVICSGVSPAELNPDFIKQLGASHVCFPAGSLTGLAKQQAKLRDLLSAGVMLYVDGVDQHKQLEEMHAAGIYFAAGELLGDTVSEDDYILGELATAR